MAIRASLSRFPVDRDAHEACGLPWGVTVTPFSQGDEHGGPPTYGGEGNLLPRCENCWAYFNTYCGLDQWSWNCALCSALNGLTSEAIDRYSQEESEKEEMEARPVYVAAVDLSSSEEFLELVKSAILAALEVCPGSLFGLMAFSHKIGLYDVQGAIPVVKNVFIPPDSDAKLPVDLEDAMPLLSFLAPVETCKDRIAAALETLRPTTSWERTTAAGQGIDGVLLGGRGFGVAMEALFSYLGSEYGNTFALARVFAFLSGPPDYGAGQLDTRRYGEQYASKREDADRALLPEQTPFYKDLASVAVESGVCVDIFAVTNEYTDLASLKFLSIESGGSLLLYASTDDSTLPQDMYRMLSRPCAFGCILRLRTSSEFKPGHSYGHFFPDPQYENVQHIICCDAFATYAYEFDFANTAGFSRHTDPPVIQTAFQYSVIVPRETSNTAINSSTVSKHFVQRRLRIRTLQLSTALNINKFMTGLMQTLFSCLEQGVREGRSLLYDWLIILAAQYNDAYKIVHYDTGNIVSNVDAAFTQCPQLQPIPRLIFALLRNPLLRFHEEGVHPDYRIYLQCLFRCSIPRSRTGAYSLHRAIYPLLASYASPDKQSFPRHSLSRAALITSGSPIFLLDAFTNLVVYYSSSADASIPFPPPQDCALRTVINRMKQERSVTPRLTFIRGDRRMRAFGGMTGFVAFLEEISRDVVQYLKQEA
ncbi:unnamed protein product [Spirodela intermedia]|uniref:Uncharacterized protein n=1 Tax=Spirodela intermedia TaxID=51605 RepID=A0A7I8ISA7_SPIIN|nr:unnamed protein product [Spirodela intermedia]CAA6660666.1 unnamed protein product [Spirodela intermedia]